jgi:hypothetical protein
MSPAVQAALTSAAFQAGQTFIPMTQVGKSLGEVQSRDSGFISVGFRPVFTGQMNGATDPYGNPLSFARQYQSSSRRVRLLSIPFCSESSTMWSQWTCRLG